MAEKPEQSLPFLSSDTKALAKRWLSPARLPPTSRHAMGTRTARSTCTFVTSGSARSSSRTSRTSR